MRIFKFNSMKFGTIILGLLFSISSIAQQPATSAQEVQDGLSQKKELEESSLVAQTPFTNIGPTIMSGRVVDLAVNPDRPSEFYVGYASGGVWYTNNNGTTFSPVLDSSPTQNVGCLAVNWTTGEIWVGTGEINASRSSYAGIGLLRSLDKGETWENMGLTDSHHISKIEINPNNPNEIVVGVVGHLYSKNTERGIYKSIDGGKSWKNTLFINDQTGIIDLAIAPNNFEIMYATAWEKDRKAWNFIGNGNGSAIYKSTDAGDNWELVSTKESGFPTGEGVGRIGVAVFNDDVVYAIHDNQFRRDNDKKGEKNTDQLTKEDFKSMSKETFLALNNKKLNAFLKTNGFQEKYRAENVKQMVRNDAVKPIDLAKYLEDANSMLFDTPVIGAEVFKSEDGGKTWKKTHEKYLDGIYYSYGYYFGKIHVSPRDQDQIYIYGVPILKSKDGGKSFTSINAENVHADHHALWINPKLEGHMINGNDGGVNITYDDGKNWIKNNTPSVGQFYAINVDYETPYNVYGGLQDNGVWKGPHTYTESTGWHASGDYNYKFIMGGDGMQIQIDNRNTNIVYTGFQFGNYFRLDLDTNDQKYIQPKHTLGETPYRFNWQTPILLSEHNQDILYLGGIKLMRSLNKGDTWEAISDDLTTGGKKGNVAYGTLTSISESSFQFGLLYVGSDDGKVHVSKDGGGSWKNISNNLPKDLWVSRVQASTHVKERVYLTLNGYRWDDFTPYVYVSENYGDTWKLISNNLPASSVNVIREDHVNPDLLYLGTDNGVYVSLNRGASWELFSNGLPNVAVHDIVLQKEANDLLIGTHGRSIYKTNVALLQEYNTQNSEEGYFANIQEVKHSRRWGNSYSPWFDPYTPEITVAFYSPKEGKDKMQILNENGDVLNEIEVDVKKGFNYIPYDLTYSDKATKNAKNKEQELKPAPNGEVYLHKGEYKISLKKLLNKKQTTLFVK